MTKLIVLMLALFLISGSESALSDILANLQKKVDTGIDAAINQVDGILESSKNKANKVGEELKTEAEKFTQDLKESIEKVIDEVQERAEKIIENAGAETSECKEYLKSLDELALNAMGTMSNCVTEKLELGGGYIESMIKLGDDLKGNFTVIRGEAHDCVKDVDGIISSGRAIICLNLVSTKASWVTAKSIPSFTSQVAKLNLLMNTIQLQLPVCAALNGFPDFAVNAETVFENVRTCVKSKTSSS